jgi:iron complex outermembrane receptor protein
LPVEVVVQGNDDLKPETMEAFEAGWRWRPNRSVSVDLALYRNEYEHLILLRSLPPQVVFAPSPHIEQHMAYRNAGSAVSHGAELATEWAAMDGLRLQAFAARHDIDEGRLETGVSGGLGGKDVGRTASARARIDVSPDTEIDLAWRSLGASLDGAVPAYDAVDMRVAWRPLHSLELSFGVENLLDEEHVESDDFLSGSLGVELGRSYFASFVWRPKR